MEKRMFSQPIGTFNCGSVFKNSPNFSAGKTIDKLGLKSVKIGDIQISSKHANFFINQKNATCKDFKDLLAFVKQKAMEQNIKLSEEVIIVNQKRKKL